MASELGVQTIQHTNGTDAIDIGSNGSTSLRIPSFMVEGTNIDQSYTAADAAVVQFDDVKLDTESAWDSTNHRYKPTIAGWYSFSGAIRLSSTGGHTYFAVELIKNGTSYSTNDAWLTQVQHTSATVTNGTYPLAQTIVYLNGTTDYVNLCFRSSHDCTLSDNTNFISWFCGQLVKAGS